MRFLGLLLVILLVSCSKQEEPPLTINKPFFNWQRINSRDEGDPSAKFFLYYAKVPSDWIRKDPSPNESIYDTTIPLCEFFIVENDEKVRITVHNFPSTSIDERIPPSAQISRWKQQFQYLNPALTRIKPVSHAGYVGLFIQCQGELNHIPTKLMGWAMQLASEYYERLSFDNSFLSRQERADYTIKAMGPTALMDKHAEGIYLFADSFRLIDELPTTP